MKRLLSSLYFQVLVAIVLGVLLGRFAPEWAVPLKPLGDGFIKLIKMLIAPIIFTTVVAGIAGMGNIKKVGRVGVAALLYFEVVTSLALVIGLVIANAFNPGVGVHANAASLNAGSISTYVGAAKAMSPVDMILHIIPNSFAGAFVDGDILQVLLVALLAGFALAQLGEHGRPIANLLQELARMFFSIVTIVTRLAPVAAFGAMAFTVGEYGFGSLAALGKLMVCVYLTCGIFIAFVLGSLARLGGFSLWKIIRYIREELLIVIGTSSSEAALPGLMLKLERAGCARSVVGLVVPAGYSFNLDGTCIYLTMAAIFIAQATDTPLTLGGQIGLLMVLLLTSKGAAGVTGSGFIVLAATLKATGRIPVEGMALILGVDRFMSEARAITNFIGNAVATLLLARWDGEFDRSKAGAILSSPIPAGPSSAGRPLAG
jgi:aerobic C4-dicarboxylate transport protein